MRPFWRRRRLATYFVLAALQLANVGCANSYPPEQVPLMPDRATAPELYEATIESDYSIQVGDVLQINSYFDPGLKQSVTVQPDGRVSLLLVGTVMAARRTPRELGEELAQSYRRYLDDRDITVIVTEAAGQAVYVGGEVKSPSVLPLRGDLTLLQAITAAGGFLPTANRDQVLILRPTAGGRFQTFQTNVDAVLRNESGELYLRRRDIVYAPKTNIAKVDQFVDQYLNQIMPRWVTAMFGYQFFHQTGNSVVTTTIPR